MEMSLSTFILEVINFLVLVWILKRFLYRPVLDIVAQRRARIDETVADAKRKEAEAQSLKERYEKRLVRWEAERNEARDKLAHELDEERAGRLAELRQSLDREAEKGRAAEERRLADLGNKLEQRGLELGARFASRLLAASATEALQGKLLDCFLADFDATPRDRIASLLGNADLPPDSVEISSAFKLSRSQQQALEDRATSLCGADVPVSFTEDPSLVAGLRMTIGGCVLGLNLKDELDGFAGLANVAA
jgi:F-type H+-transporting ATPase subunit b